MADPFALLPLNLAAHGGTVDGVPASQLVAAGLTLLQRSAPLVRSLAGRRAAILLPTSPAFLVALAASEGRGAVLVNPLASATEVEHQLRDAEVGAVFTSSALASRLPPEVTRVLLDDAPRAARVLHQGSSARDVDLGSHHGLALEGSPTNPGSEEEAIIVYTSAMAGTPLGAILTHANLLANARATSGAAQLGASDRALALLPFAHLFGLTVSLAAPLVAGGAVSTMARFHPGRAVERLVHERTTLLVGVPAVYHALLAALKARANVRESLAALRVCICGGAVLPLELQERWFDITGVELRQGYGLTEAGPVCLFNACDRPNLRGTLGPPLPGVEVTVRSPISWSDAGESSPPARDDAIPRGEAGEICVRGPNVFRGYVSDGDRGLVVRDGWLHTGDLGRCDPDGTVVFVGLLKPMFTRSGFNVYPREIERVVRAMPGVDAVEVRAVPEPSREHDIHLRVDGDVTEKAVRHWCEERLAVYKRPSHLVVRRRSADPSLRSG